MTPAARRACVTLHRNGWPVETIAALTGRHYSTIWRALRREGVDTPGRWR